MNNQTVKIYVVTILMFAGMVSLASAAHLSQSEALRSVQAVQSIK